jgi:hypothetical protein
VKVRSCLLLCLLWTSQAVLRADEPSHPALDILLERCVACHHPKQASGGLDLTSATSFRAGGESGSLLDLDAPETSYLLERVESGEMPPEEKGLSQELAGSEIEVLKDWLQQGAPWSPGTLLDPFEKTTQHRAGRDWWAFQPIQTPDIPNSPLAHPWARNPIDRFIAAKLDDANITPAPPAEKATLLRRVYIDLIGLPPTEQQIQRFLDDPSKTAYESVVDELLDSPHFGERWGRHWLDLVRFAETSGYERDQAKPYAWRYRDWVVQAFNDDLPYDQFLTQQIAGDEVTGANEDTMTATGFLRLGTWNDEPNDPHEYKYERLEDLVHATSSAFLGLTVKCARCHDHKFDPIPQEDYYRMAAAFWAGPIQPRGSELLGGPSAEELGYDRVLGWTDLSATPPPLHLLLNGDPKRPQEEVNAGFLSLLPELDRPLEPPTADARTTGRRLQLAQWMTHPDNPITARVIINRLWQHHFGQALVRSPNNFGFTGEQPTHPELLDWLAGELIHPHEKATDPLSNHRRDATPWTLKRIHKLMVMSATYRQSSNHPLHDSYTEIDPANRLWWRAERRRLDAETLRDAMFMAAGNLDSTVGGESFKGSIDAEALEGLSRKSSAWQASPLEHQNRRSLYMFTQRSLPDPFLATFDLADTTLPCSARDVSTVAPQALALLNGTLTHRLSFKVAERVAQQASQPEEQVQWSWRMIHQREPTARELELGVAHIREQQRRFTVSIKTSPPPKTDATWPSELQLALFADQGVVRDESGRVRHWRDQSGQGHDASQDLPLNRPEGPQASGDGLQFDGNARFLKVSGTLVTQQQYTLMAVATDRGKSGHREIISNWNGGAGNSVTSLFLGLTDQQTFRFSDAFVGGSWEENRDAPAVLTAVGDSTNARLWVNQHLIADRGSALPERRLDTDWVIGQQGNIQGEYWQGEILAVLVWNRALTDSERERVVGQLAQRFDLSTAPPQPTPEILALQSLCHVLLNSNEFIYVD